MVLDRHSAVPVGPTRTASEPSVVDWLICATAVQHVLVIVHDAKDFVAAAGVHRAARKECPLRHR
jgi:hypothetical protein